MTVSNTSEFTPEMNIAWTISRCQQAERLISRALPGLATQSAIRFFETYVNFINREDFKYVAFEKAAYMIQHFFGNDTKKECRFAERLWRSRAVHKSHIRLKCMLRLYFYQRRYGFLTLHDSRLPDELADAVRSMVIYLGADDVLPYNLPYWQAKGKITYPCRAEKQVAAIVQCCLSGHITVPVHIITSDGPLEYRQGKVIVDGFIGNDQGELVSLYDKRNSSGKPKSPKLTAEMMFQLLKDNDVNVDDYDIVGPPDFYGSGKNKRGSRLFYRHPPLSKKKGARGKYILSRVGSGSSTKDNIIEYKYDTEEDYITPLEILHSLCRDGRWVASKPPKNASSLKNIITRIRAVITGTGYSVDPIEGKIGWKLVGPVKKEKPKIPILILFPVTSRKGRDKSSE